MRAEQPTDPIETERLRSIYGQLPLTATVNLVNYLATGLVLAAVIPPPFVVPWCGSMVAVTILRFALWFWHRRAFEGATISFWTIAATATSFLSGNLWGWEAFFLFPDQAQYQLFLALVIGGMCAGAATGHAAHTPTVVAFILPATLPLGLRFILQAGQLQLVTGLMTLAFSGAMCLISHRFARWFSATFKANHDLGLRTAELDQANAMLRQEIESHRTTGAMLRESQKMEAIGLLTAGVAHDFNNLLMTISGCAGVMARRLEPDSPVASGLAVIGQAVARGGLLTRQLLAFGRKQTLSPRKADLNQLIDGMQRLLESTVADRARLTFRLDPDLGPAFIDTQQLEYAIINVVINARDAMPAGGQVTVRTTRAPAPAPDLPHGEYAVIAITDTGTGMSDTVRQKAFDPFFTTKPAGHGSGLGLSQVYGLMRQSGGTVVIDSAPGRGTTVRLYLPRYHAPSDGKPESEQVQPSFVVAN